MEIAGQMHSSACGSPYSLARKQNISAEEVERLLNTQSGLLGISGMSGISQDMRVLMERVAIDERARLTVDVFCYRAKKHVGAYLAAMGEAAVVVFRGGIGEGSSRIRQGICEGLETRGLEVDPALNTDTEGERRVTRERSRLHA
jgi:acetate kinase